MGQKDGEPSRTHAASGEEVLGGRRMDIVDHDSRLLAAGGWEAGDQLGEGVGCGDAPGLEVTLHRAGGEEGEEDGKRREEGTLT